MMIMAKSKDQKRKEYLLKKEAVTALKFQTEWGFKQLVSNNVGILQMQMENELVLIGQLDLCKDLLAIKTFVDAVQRCLQAQPVPGIGDFTKSLVAIALGISRVKVLTDDMTFLSWSELVQKKMLSIYYMESIRNSVVEWAKQNGYHTSTYLGIPIVRFDRIFLLIRHKTE
jgi:hypothetical protein